MTSQGLCRLGFKVEELTDPFVNEELRKAAEEDIAALRLELSELRFWEQVETGDGCWLWRGARTGEADYGVHVFDRVRTLAHRFAWESVNGPIGDGLTIDHLCRNTGCVRPDHLEPVTRAENNRRAAAARPLASHCLNDHEYTPENTYRRPSNGSRRCRTCQQESYRRWADKNLPRNKSGLDAVRKGIGL